MAPIHAVAVVMFAFLSAGQDRTPEPARLQGTVLDAVSGQPVKKAAVILRQEKFPDTGYATLTDNAGRFEFTGLAPGTWLAEVQRDGYVPAGSATNEAARLRWRIPSDAGNQTIRLTPAGVITGRVLDQDGEPVAGASVNATPAGAGTQTGSYAQTNDLGEYRVYNLAPGKYVLVAAYEPPWRRMGTKMVPKADKRQGAEEYVPTYYPAGVDASDAVPVAVVAGRPALGMDIKLLRAAVVRIRGRAVAPEGALSPLGFVTLMEPRKGGPAPGKAFHSVLRPGGAFEFDAVRPGHYLLQCDSVIDEKQRLRGRVWLDVADTDIEGVQVALSPPRIINGRLSVEGGARLPEGLHAILAPREEDPTHQGGGFSPVRKDGSFALEEVYDGQYDLLLTKLQGEPDDFYVTRMSLGDDDVLEEGLNVRGGGPALLEVVLRDDGATLDCAVTSADGKPAVAHVIAVPQDRAHALVLYGHAESDDTGAAQLKGLAPGSYRVYAFQGKQEINFFRPESLKPFQDSSKTVRLEAKQSTRIEIKAVQE